MSRPAVLAAGFLVALSIAAAPARADNAMGYKLVSASDAASLPRKGGSLGMDIERAQQITDEGLTFDMVRIKQVRRGGAAAAAGLSAGDEIIAVDGRVFATLAAFAAYIGATPPGGEVMIDIIPQGGGPKQAERVSVAVGNSARSGQAPSDEVASQSDQKPGMSTGKKVAIGVGAAALFGCYELGCFSHHPAQQAQPAR